ncbi:protein dehydration-induced 19 homolog 4 [Phtheirospermum japonicum]|uniref:Protein dehydration-induced 19 homolog 4 n=1 Tax=Phtheirospermum japonicum TaxID=374723 RepID=A0A830B6J8_9LAMI|nr:protein dehydration-induced 19 homolog 4 [Phtheirospermum japonicum]
MGDRLYQDLGIAFSSYCEKIADQYDYHEDENETEGEYEYEEEVNAAEKEAKFEELACPFCTEDFDVLGLCCHIDADHRMEVKPGEKHLRYMKESHSVDSSSDVATDPKLLSFVNNMHHAYRPQTNQSASSTEASISAESPNGDLSERIQLAPSTDWNNERTRRPLVEAAEPTVRTVGAIGPPRGRVVPSMLWAYRRDSQSAKEFPIISTPSFSCQRNQSFRCWTCNRELPRECYCELPTRVLTSKTSKNPDRRFLSCPNRGDKKCTFFMSVDQHSMDQLNVNLGFRKLYALVILS